MSAKSANKSTDYPPSTLTPLQNKAIKWIAGMRFAMQRFIKASPIEHNLSVVGVRASELMKGHIIVSGKGLKYKVLEITGKKILTVKCRSIATNRLRTYHFAPIDRIYLEAD